MRSTWRILLTSSVVAGVVLVSPTAASATARMADIGHPQVGVTPGQVVSSSSGPSTDVHAAAYADPGVLTFGDAVDYGAPTNGAALNAPVVTMAATTDGKGYWLSAADGGIFAYGDAGYFGSAGSLALQAPLVGMEATNDSQGYWQVAIDGGIFSYGDAGFYGSTGAMVLNQPIVGMAPTPDDKGYWLVAADGGIFAFGDATFYGSTGGMTLNSPIVGMAATKDGKGYWLVAADGGVFAFGDAAFDGSLGADDNLPASIISISRTPDGGGYWLAGAGGGVYAFGDAVSYGQSSGIQPTEPVTAIVSTPTGDGYWLLEPDAFPVSFSHPGGGSAVVRAATSQVEGDPDTGYFCNPYGPCEAWCALFATWAWEQAGVPIPRYAFVGDVYTWAAQHTAVLSPSSVPSPGDAVLYGTGPQSVASAVHMGIVAQVWPDGAIDTVEGDAGPAPEGHFNVIINGPFLPSQSLDYNGFGIFAYAVP
jgi:hypothetical protein